MFEELQSGKCYKFAVATNTFKTGERIILWP